jgi:hypothetical protein
VKARAIDCFLDRLKEELELTQRSTTQIGNDLKLDLKKEALRVKASQRVQEARDKIFSIQSAFQERLIELHNQHSQELVTFAEQYAAALELESIRIIPDAIYLKRQAQFRARNRDYGAAEALFEESNQARRDQTDTRQAAVRQLFEARRTRIEQKQISEIRACAERQAREIEFIRQRFDSEIAKLWNSLAKAATDLGITLTDNDDAFLNEFVLRDPSQFPSSPAQPPSQSTSSGSRPKTPTSGSKARPQNKSRTPTTPRSPRTPVPTG